ncbi:efflux RND transporter permease subunit [Leptothermofonsia sp. ETS-13]|uniref:efflux RND transporter permease subunit n=1 Tax=Leptothermofonsia sp. ETS-13 TaxID=3035696 RepID=UPI003B9EB9A2
MQNFQQSGFSFSKLSIRRHIGILMLMLTVLILGFFYLTRLPVDLLPSITYPRIGVRLDAPGISPEVAVDEITKPLEQALSTTEGVVQIYSQTREGQVSLDLFFQPGSNVDQALNDATATFNRYRNRLPDEIESPRIFKFDPTQLPVYEFALTSPTLRGVDLRVFADEELARELTVVPGVASADVSGGLREEVRVKIDLNRLQSLGLGINDVLNGLEERNQDISGGRILGQTAEPLTRSVGRFREAEEIRDLQFVLRGQGSGVESQELGTRSQEISGLPPSQRVYLRDFAEVIDGTEEERVLVNLNGEPAVKISIQKQPEANTVQVVDGVKQRIDELRRAGLISPDMVITPTLDESRFIKNSIANVTSAGLSGALLAAIAVFLFLGSLRQTLIIVIAIPLASLAAIILMGLFGLSLNIFSLGGLAIGVGIVVDNSIVMLENIANRIHQNTSVTNGHVGNGNGLGRVKEVEEDLQSAIAPSSAKISQSQILRLAESSGEEVESALVASTATNLVSVLPFLLLGGFVSLLFNELILTISFAVAASLLIALTVVPMMSSRLLTIGWSSRLSQFWLLRQFNQRFEAITRSYGRLLVRLLRRRTLVIAAAVLVLGGGSLLMVGQIPQEVLPRINTGQARLFAQFPPGTSLETNRRVMESVDEILRQQPETEYAFTTTGGALFASFVFANPTRSSSTITLKPGSDVVAYTQRVSRKLDQLNLAGIRLRLVPDSVRGLNLNNSPIRNADLDVVLQGQNAEVLRQAGQQVLAALDEQVTLANFRPDGEDRQPEVQIKPDWERAAVLGLTAQEIGNTVKTAIEGSVPTQLQRQERLVDIRVQLDQSRVQQPSQLRQLPLFTSNNALVQLGDVAQIEEGQAPGEIQRINQRPVFLIAGNLNKGASLGAALAQVETTLAKLELPEGVTILPGYAAQTSEQLQNSLKVLGALAAFLVFVVMAVQYNSLVDPLVIMLTVPLALAGGILGLFVTQTAIGITVLVGAVLLVGIVVNNAIIMVEMANQIREQGAVDRATAILQAAPQRLRPIMMTTITTVLGLFPLALGLGEGAEFLQPLGVVVFSGLSLATLLTLFIIPCFYVLLHEWIGKLGSKRVLERGTSFVRRVVTKALRN